jgi:hypothetical protein
VQGYTTQAITAAALTLCLALNGQQSVSAQVRAWIYRKLGIDPKIVQKFTSPRGGEDRRRGMRLMSVGLSDEQEHLLWACGNCWAPAMANASDVAVLKGDGIWIVAGTREPGLVLRAEGLIDVMGRIEGEPNRLLVLQAGQAGREACAVVLRIADLKTGALLPATDAGSACIGTAEGLLHRDELLGTRKLSSTYRTNSPIGPALQLLVEDAAAPRGPESAPLTPKLNARDSTRDRFDPIWRTPSEVVYLSNPE